MGMAQGKKDMKDYWIDKYLSVSFPLESIRINSTFGSRVDPFTGSTSNTRDLTLGQDTRKYYPCSMAT